MIGLDELRAIAMALPDVEEGPPVQAARRIAAFKVAGKSFVGVERGGVTLTVSLAEKEAKAAAAEHPEAYEEIWRNGKIFMGLRVNLAKVPTRRVRELIEKSWRHSAPKRIVDAYDNRAARTYSSGWASKGQEGVKKLASVHIQLLLRIPLIYTLES